MCATTYQFSIKIASDIEIPRNMNPNVILPDSSSATIMPNFLACMQKNIQI